MLVRGTFRDAWLRAGEDERTQAFETWVDVHREWQESGCRLIVTMDDLLHASEAPSGSGNFFTVWEIPDPSALSTLTDPFWKVRDPYGLKLAVYFSIEITIGKPIVSMEHALGGPQAASSPRGAGEFAAP